MIDKNEAPEGFEAVDGDCNDCAFARVNCYDISCTPELRKDGHDVIFVKKHEIQTP